MIEDVNITNKDTQYRMKNQNYILGTLCELEIDDCENHACQNDATCIDGNSQFTCQCVIGFS